MNRAASSLTHPAVTAAVIVLAARTFLSAPAARAELRLPLPHEIHRDVREHVHDVLRTIGRIPEQILREHARHLEIFFGGSEYYGPHRHHHMTYNFPVWIDGSVFYRPYSYCNDRLYGSYSYRPEIWTGWGQQSQGHWCNDHHAYYPNGHSCFRSQAYRRSPPRYSRDVDSRRYQRSPEWQGSRGWRDDRRDAPRSWRQPQGQVDRRPEQRNERRDWSPSKRSHRPQARPDRQHRHDSKRDSKHKNGGHNGWSGHD